MARGGEGWRGLASKEGEEVSIGSLTAESFLPVPVVCRVRVRVKGEGEGEGEGDG